PIGSYFSFGSGTFPGGGTCTNTVKAGSSCTFAVVFRPMSPPLVDQDQVNGVISLSYSGGAHAGSPAVRPGLARYTSQPVITINSCENCGVPNGDGPPYDFGHWGVSTSHKFSVHNSGGSAAPIFTPSFMGTRFAFTGGGFPGIDGDCPTVAPG